MGQAPPVEIDLAPILFVRSPGLIGLYVASTAPSNGWCGNQEDLFRMDEIRIVSDRLLVRTVDGVYPLLHIIPATGALCNSEERVARLHDVERASRRILHDPINKELLTWTDDVGIVTNSILICNVERHPIGLRTVAVSSLCYA
jgi:hypothetical protein